MSTEPLIFTYRMQSSRFQDKIMEELSSGIPFLSLSLKSSLSFSPIGYTPVKNNPNWSLTVSVRMVGSEAVKRLLSLHKEARKVSPSSEFRNKSSAA